MEDLDLQEFLPKDDRLKAEMLEQWGWDGHAPTICNVGKKTYPAREDKPEESKLQVFFTEFPGYALECNVTQTKKLQQILGDRTSLWIGQKVVLLSIDTKTPQGQPAKTIQVKEYRAAAPTAPGVVTPPGQPEMPAPARQTPAQSAELPPPDELPDFHDPFAEDDLATADQIAEIEALCQQQRRNAGLVAQNQYQKNLNQLSHAQATDFLVKLRQVQQQNQKTAEAMSR